MRIATLLLHKDIILQYGANMISLLQMLRLKSLVILMFNIEKHYGHFFLSISNGIFFIVTSFNFLNSFMTRFLLNVY